MKSQPQRTTLVVESPTDYFEINISDGTVVPSKSYSSTFYARANVEEYLAWAEENGVSLGKKIPILAIGLFTRYNRYHEPCAFWRELWLEQLSESRCLAA